MKLKKLLPICMFLICGSLHAQSVDDEITYWINSGDYLQLNRRYQEEKGNIQNKTVKLMAEAFIGTAFNRPDDALKALTELITLHQESLGINGITVCMDLMVENLRYQGKYFTASDMLMSYIKQTDTFNGLTPETRSHLLEQCSLAAFGDEMKPEITRPVMDCEVPIIEKEGLLKHALYINVGLNGKTLPFLFDTGCEGYATNFVTEKFARENGIRILNDSITIHGVKKGIAKLGIADKITIGPITYRNVAFTISPGDNLLPVDTLQLDAILGSTFIKAMKECRIYPQEKKIVFPYYPTELPATGPNMMLKKGQPYLETFADEERLIMFFDTGGGVTLSGKYFQEHQEEVEANGELKKGGGIGGFGGMKLIDKYTIKDFSIKTGGIQKILPTVDVYTNPEDFDGSLGTDYIRLFNKVTINFEKMFVKFE